MSAVPVLRLGLVGAGAIAHTHVQALAGCAEVRVVAVADTRFEAARTVADQAGCLAFADLNTMLASVELDAALVCIPPVAHADVVCQLLAAGLHVLCEKPWAVNLVEARRMLAAAHDWGRVLTMASKFRFVADVVRARDVIDSGLLGPIILYENVFTASLEMRNRWNSDRRISGGGVLIDNGPHAADLMRYLLGPVAEVVASVAPQVQGLDVEETVQVLARNTAGVLARVELSWSMAQPVDYFVRVHGRDGMLSIGWKGSSYRLFGGGDAVSLGSGYDKVAAFRAQLVNFARAIAGVEPLHVTADDALASVAVIDAAYDSILHRRWTSVGVE